MIWSDDPESRPKSFLGFKARSEVGTYDVQMCCRAGLAPVEPGGSSHTHLEEVRVFPGDAALEHQWGKAPETVKRNYTTDQNLALISWEMPSSCGFPEHEGATLEIKNLSQHLRNPENPT